MGLATIDSHSLKEHTEIHKIPKFGVKRPYSKLRYSHLKMSKFRKKCMACRTVVPQRQAGHTFLCNILTFSNGCILLTSGSLYTKLGDCVNLGVINSC